MKNWTTTNTLKYTKNRTEQLNAKWQINHDKNDNVKNKNQSYSFSMGCSFFQIS